MKFIESIALALATFVLAGVIVGAIAQTGITGSMPASYGLVAWVMVQTAVTAIMLTIIPRRPVTYIVRGPETQTN